MGFSVNYRSTEPIESDRALAILSAADGLNKGRTWLSCEPLCLLANDADGRLIGGSKPTFEPHPDDVAAAALEDLPDGTVRDLLNALCELSRRHNVDWEISHDYDPGPIGFIRDGVADEGLIGQIDALGEIVDSCAEMMDEWESARDGARATDDSPNAPDDENSDDDLPPTIKLWSP